MQDFSKNPNFLQFFLGHQKIFSTRARATNINSRVDAFLGDLALQMELHIARAFKFLVDHLVHFRAGIDQAGCDNGKAPALFNISSRPKEPLRSL